jgi:hypothetical protein
VRDSDQVMNIGLKKTQGVKSVSTGVLTYVILTHCKSASLISQIAERFPMITIHRMVSVGLTRWHHPAASRYNSFPAPIMSGSPQFAINDNPLCSTATN